MRVLVVKSDFLGYQKGSVISDPKTIADVMNSPYKVHVVASAHEHIADQVEEHTA